MTIQNKRLSGILLVVTLLLSVPFVAMQFTNNVGWSLFDFVVAGILLFGTGLLCELVLRKVHTTGYRLVIIGVLLAILLLIWIEVAVGLYGTPFAGS